MYWIFDVQLTRLIENGEKKEKGAEFLALQMELEAKSEAESEMEISAEEKAMSNSLVSLLKNSTFFLFNSS